MSRLDRIAMFHRDDAHHAAMQAWLADIPMSWL
jgi:hypothetical protein